MEPQPIRSVGPVPPGSEADKGKWKIGSSVDPNTQPIKKFLEVNLEANSLPYTLAVGGSSSMKGQTSLADDKWWKLLVNFEDLTLDVPTSSWDSRLDSRQFVADKMSLNLLKPVVQHLGVLETF